MKRAAVGLLKIIGALLTSLALWEVVLRVAILSPVPYQHNEQLGWMPKPHSTGLFAMEGRGWCRYNELGFRDAPIAPSGAAAPRRAVPAATDPLRVLCLGDSYAEGAQMPAEQAYPQLLQTLLNQRETPPQLSKFGLSLSGAASAAEAVAAAAAPNARVFNAGRAGTQPVYAVALSDAYKKIFRPDWTVVLVRDGWNEVFDRGQEIHLRTDGEELALTRHWHWEAMSPLKKRLVLWGVRDLALLQYGKLHFDELRRAGAAPTESAPTVKPAVPNNTPSPTKASTPRHLRAIGWTLARLKAAYPHLVILHVPYGSAQRNALLAPSEEEATLRSECRRQQIPCIAMRPYFEADFARSQHPPFGFANTLPWKGHPNARAHALIALALYDYLTPRLQNSAGRVVSSK